METTMDATTISKLLEQLDEEGVVDVRRNPDTNRRGHFLAGWHDHSERNQIYVERTLQQLTWHNLGWRLARTHVDAAGIDDDEVRDLFAAAEDLWWKRRR
jgi:hypothetical protein